MPESIRLNKFIATQKGIGRRAVDDLIAAGKVTVNGQVAILGARVSPADKVVVAGKTLVWSPAEGNFLYIMLNKPTGYVCSRRQQGDVPTIYSLLPAKYQHLKTVGRLDKDSSGLILLTNDGDFAHRLTHPSFVKTKVYEVTLDKPLEPLHHQMISDVGLDLPDGKSQLSLERQSDDYTVWRVTMHEGRNRQIRRTFAALGYEVVKLHRTAFGNYTLGQLDSGHLEEIVV